ncbi:hypothetical protein [Phocaeicola barnesiae]|uniref:hypothetical protein n=1 Tax=Phocaeicola barnesiae TaxID=376804 RepID=UPI0025A366E8|nr:hypothetical protein [Phocaeicola barnesiae]MDM8253881.1 hypothetical protein [Phocaeicola barnesiae]
MDGEIRVFGYELMNYLYCNPFISDEELYKCVYRLTDRFCELDIAILTSEIDEWALDSMHDPYDKFHLVQDVCNRVKALISAGDNGTYRPLLTILTEKDMNDLRVVYDCCSILIEGEYTFGESGEGLNPTIKGKEKGATLLKPIYEKYKDFSLEVKIEACHPNSIGKQGYRRLFYLDKVLELWEKDAEPFMRLFGQTNDSKVETVSLPDELDTDEAKKLFSCIQWCKKDGNLYKWTGSLALFGYFVDKTSDYLGIRPSNNRIPWKKYRIAFQMKDTDTAEQAVNDYKNKQKNEPEGFLEIKRLCH